MITPATMMTKMKISDTVPTRVEMLRSVWSNFVCAACSRWRILTDRPSIAAIVAA